MKRLPALLMCIIMVLSLTACGKGEDTQTNTVPATTQAQTPPPEFQFGATYGTSYNNETLGIGISLPSGFSVTSNAELATMNGFDETLMTENLPEAMADTKRAYIFVATDNAGTYLNIVVENLKLAGKTFITGEEYFNLYTDETIKEYEDMGAQDITLTPSKITIYGVEYNVEIISYTLDGAAESDTRIAFPAGNFMAVMTIKGDSEVILNRIYGL